MNEKKLTSFSLTQLFFLCCSKIVCQLVSGENFHRDENFHHPLHNTPKNERGLMIFLISIVSGWKMHFPSSLNDDFPLSMTKLHNQVSMCVFEFLFCLPCLSKARRRKNIKKDYDTQHISVFIHSLTCSDAK